MNRVEAISAMIEDEKKVTHPSFPNGYLMCGENGRIVACEDGEPDREWSVSANMCEDSWSIWKPKIKMWQWITRVGKGRPRLTSKFYASGVGVPVPREKMIVVGRADWTEIEIDE